MSVPPYNNPPIESQFYKPGQFFISDIALGQTTTVTTELDNNYVIGQLVRLIIPSSYGSAQLNEKTGYVISLPSADEIELGIDSSKNVDTFISSPFTATITGATQANPCVLTASSHFINGQYVDISGVGGMNELNGRRFLILAASTTTLTIDVDASGYDAYTSGGVAILENHATTKPQIMAIGNIANGTQNSSGRNNLSISIPGSFINISPL